MESGYQENAMHKILCKSSPFTDTNVLLQEKVGQVKSRRREMADKNPFSDAELNTDPHAKFA